jgi:ATP-binding cassette, subfamily B, bacterial
MAFKFIAQHDQMDCGSACLSMIAKYHGKNYSLQYLRDISFTSREGISLQGLIDSANVIGLDAFPVKLNFKELIQNKSSLPCILHWSQNHFIVLTKIKKKLFTNNYEFQIADPDSGVINLSTEQFLKYWISDKDTGVCLFLIPNDHFYQRAEVNEVKLSIKKTLQLLKPFKNKFFTLMLLLLLGSGLSFVFPFLTQNLIDNGVNKKNVDYIGLILLFQLGLFSGYITIEIIRNWIMLHVGTRLSITIISDFLKKLLQLPLRYFDSKMNSDFNQRIQDNERIEEFLTSQSLVTFFSIISFSVFFGVLWYYNFKILFVYLSLTIISVLWSFFWMKKRKMLDYYRFKQRSENQESIYEMLHGVAEMKLNQFADYKLEKWREIQQKLFKINIRTLKLNQLQLSGFEFINQIKNIIVTFLAATFVVQGKMTLGELLSVSYIVGQMNSPVGQLITFFRSLQDAKLSLVRLNEVQDHPEEEIAGQVALETNSKNSFNQGIEFKNLSFQYESSRSPYVLKDINFTIPEGKITAIVGASGSGKTTLMKLLLKFYKATQGKLNFNAIDINDISALSIRKNCGVVMQDGFIFSDTIERNIATGDEVINKEKLKQAVSIANIEEFITSLPLQYNTKIGASGNGISGGQKQRILIARAVYKNPQYIFFDEATSALDSENEKIIHENLQTFFKGKTVLIIAHRLSTVKNADQIIVLKNGKIVEQGNHASLVNSKKEYYNLVKNQLELGN